MANRRQGGSGKKPHRKSKKNGEGYSQPELPKGAKKQVNNNNEEEGRQPQLKKQGRPLTVKEQVLEVVKESKKGDRVAKYQGGFDSQLQEGGRSCFQVMQG